MDEFKKILLFIFTLVIGSIILDFSLDMANKPDTILNIAGLVIILVTILVSVSFLKYLFFKENRNEDS